MSCRVGGNQEENLDFGIVLWDVEMGHGFENMGWALEELKNVMGLTIG